ncbi:MAG: hypothetical protein V1914_00055 [archaeon]
MKKEVKRPKKEYRRLDWKFWLIVTILISGAIYLSYHFGAFKKTCDDNACFKEALENCAYAKFLTTKNLNYYLYTIKGPTNGACEVDFELKKMAIGTTTEKIKQFEGKWMTCYLPKSEIAKMETVDFEGVLNYCSGPLKEAMYELIIEKLYTIIIKNMGAVIGAVEDTLIGEI